MNRDAGFSLILLALFGCIVAFIGSYSYNHGVVPLNLEGAALKCNPDIWKFVYHPQRLKVIEPCKKIEGVLVNFVQEADGDFHGRVEVQDKTLINSDNVVGQHGYLVIEGICQGKITQTDAISPCQGYNGPKFNLKPLLGKKVEITGPYIQDTEHSKGAGGWLEIHPLLGITPI